MILKIILNIVITILSMLFNVISVIQPTMNFTQYIAPFLEIIQDTLQTSVNFVYFMVGDALHAFTIAGITMLGWKYLLFPVIVLIRRVFIKGGDT